MLLKCGKTIAELQSTRQMPSISPEAMATGEMIGQGTNKRELTNKDRMNCHAHWTGQKWTPPIWVNPIVTENFSMACITMSCLWHHACS